MFGKGFENNLVCEWISYTLSGNKKGLTECKPTGTPNTDTEPHKPPQIPL